MPSGTSELNVVANDVLGRRVELTVVEQPGVGVVWVEEGVLKIDIPNDTPENIVFTYRLDNGSQVSEATVVISPQQQLSWETEGSTFIDSGFDVSSGATAASDETGEQESGLAEKFKFLRRPPAVWLTLADLRLPLLPLTSAASVSLIGLLLLWRSGYLRRFATIRGVVRGDELTVDGDDQFRMRYDADEIWLTGRRRRRNSTVQIETPPGFAWVKETTLESPLT